MNAGIYLLVCLGGGIGAALRFIVDGEIKARTTSPFYAGTIIINLTGCLMLGLLTGLAEGGTVGSDVLAVVGTGVLGGYTTFSTASFEAARLLQEGRRGAGLWNALGTLFGGVALAGLGLVAGVALSSR